MKSVREISSKKLYHIIIRGINKQDIFLDDLDKKKFKREILKTKEKFGYLLYAYVIMPNHVHLVIYDTNDNLSKSMQSLLIRFSEYINKKYERVGHLFQGRFKSKIINDEEYLNTVIKYIHYNPEKAGISKYSEYDWSSYQEYVDKKKYKITDVSKFFEEYVKDEKDMNSVIAEFEKQHMEYKESKEIELKNRIEYELENKVSDEDLISYMVTKFKIKSIYDLQRYNVKYLRDLINPIIEELNVSAFQISRVTGISKAIIYKMREK